MFSYNIKDSNQMNCTAAQQLLTNRIDIAMNHTIVVQRLQARSGVVEPEPAIRCDAQDVVGHKHSLQTSQAFKDRHST